MTTIAILSYSNCSVYIEQFDETKETDEQYVEKNYNKSEVSWMCETSEDSLRVWDCRNEHNYERLL